MNAHRWTLGNHLGDHMRRVIGAWQHGRNAFAEGETIRTSNDMLRYTLKACQR